MALAYKRTPLIVADILAWAEAHYQRVGAWPTARSGPIVGAPGETWAAVAAALRKGLRGLPGGDTLGRLLRRERRAVNRRGRPAKPVPQRRLLLRWRSQGLTLAEIGLRLRVSRQAVSQQLRRIGNG
jgi:hypothetical protein